MAPSKIRTPNLWTRRAVDLLSDGEWHDYQEIQEDAIQFVPEEEAYRQGSNNRDAYFRSEGKEPPPNYRPHATLRQGRNKIFNSSMRKMVLDGLVEVIYKNPESARRRPLKVRLKP